MREESIMEVIRKGWSYHLFRYYSGVNLSIYSDATDFGLIIIRTTQAVCIKVDFFPAE